MTNRDHEKHPAGQVRSGTIPEPSPCPSCETEIEAWTGEAEIRCPACGRPFTEHLPPPSAALQDSSTRHHAKLTRLIQGAQRAGATEAAVLSARSIVVEAELADRCREPPCENYGLSRSCPPHLPAPSAFEEELNRFHQAIFFRIDVPSTVLYSSDSREVFQLLHEIAAGIEKSAAAMGFSEARAFAGGSCKKIFCHEHPDCLALSQGGACRHPDSARPSMSGFGINVAKLYQAVGWAMGPTTREAALSGDKTASVCGLVLIC